MNDGAPGARAAIDVAAVFLAALAGVLALVVVGDAGPLSYKSSVRALAIAWLVVLLVPAGRARLPYRPDPADLPLALFGGAALVSVALGGGHWGDARNLVASAVVGLLARTLAAIPERRAWLPGLLGGMTVFLVGRELVLHPELLPPREVGRYLLVAANPNVLGFLLAFLAPIFLVEALVPGGGDGRAAAPARAAFAACFGVAVLGILLTFSRVAAVGLATGIAVVTFDARRRAAALVLGAAGAAVFVAVQRPDAWIDLRAAGDADRLRIAATAFAVFTDHPLLGVGFGINNLEEPFRARYLARYDAPLFRFHSGNQVLDLLAGTGVVGTLLALWWAARIGAGAWRAWRSATSVAGRLRAAGGFAALAAAATMSVLEPALYHGKVVPVLFVVLGFVQGSAAPAKDRASA